MTLRGVSLVLSLVALLIAAAGAGADVKIVTPSDMQGMVLATVTSGSAMFQDPAPPPGAALGAGGTGAVYMALGQKGSCSTCDYCGQVWLGTNAYNGVALADIAQLSYETWCSNNGIWQGGTQNKWSPPRQPCGLRLVIDTNNDPPDAVPIRMLIFRPLKNAASGQIGFGFSPYPEDFNYLNRWRSWDCLYGADSIWAEFTYNASPCLWTGTWTELLAKYPNAKIAAPALQLPAGAGQWPPVENPPDTPNGCGLSLQWGAETMINGDWPTQPWKNWWRDAWDGIGFVDYLQVGVGSNLDVYDFEADTKNEPLVASGKGFQASAMRASCLRWPYVVYGRAVTCTLPIHGVTGWQAADHFCLEDGSGQQCEVVCQQHMVIPVEVGKYYRVTGKAFPRYGLQAGGQPIPMRIHTDAYSYPPLVTELVEEPQ